MEVALKGLVDLEKFENYLMHHLPKVEIDGPPKNLSALEESMSYTIKAGGKRFRPALSMLTAKTLGRDETLAYGVGCAVEWIHSYSLIHDDLPCMDDDDVRRGQPANHKRYGEALALLAGDALITDVFGFLADQYMETPDKAVRMIKEMSYFCGLNGMVGGQSVDIDPSQEQKSQWMAYIHEKKTGALIQASVVCAAIACGASDEQLGELRAFAGQMGLAFQLQDDLLDWDPSHPEPTSFVNVVGPEETERMLADASDQCLTHLAEVNLPVEFFAPLVDYNKRREI